MTLCMLCAHSSSNYFQDMHCNVNQWTKMEDEVKQSQRPVCMKFKKVKS